MEFRVVTIYVTYSFLEFLTVTQRGTFAFMNNKLDFPPLY